MRPAGRISIILMLLAMTFAIPAEETRTFALVLHGGAGTITRATMTPERETEYREKLEESLRTGYAILEEGGTSLDAVEAAIRVMEESPLFNAGKGSVFTHHGRNELDASIMNGRTLEAGAVAGVTIIRNPISAARAVMEKSPHVMMAGEGANLFATTVGLEIVDPSFFWTERRWKQLQERLMEGREFGGDFEPRKDPPADDKRGTVGVVAVDIRGDIAAGTSTGGMTDKRYGRVGDSPIIGAGTYADNRTCGVSGTGHGEYFIRLGVARDVAAMMEYQGLGVAEAAGRVVEKLTRAGATGGVVAVDAEGNIAMEFNTEGMYRGFIREDGVPHVLIYGN
jgi:L-asparaginase / beta-aspartyl-peptidase